MNLEQRWTEEVHRPKTMAWRPPWATFFVGTTLTLILVPLWFLRRSSDSESEPTTNAADRKESHSTCHEAVDDESVDDVEDMSLGQHHPHNTSKHSGYDDNTTTVLLQWTAYDKKKEKTRSVEPADPHIPGTQTLYVRTFGCSHNSSDSEVMMGLLRQYGYRFTQDMNDCDLCLVNSCTVKNPSQDALMTLIRNAQAAKKAIVVAGCVPQSDQHLEGLRGISLLGTTQLSRVVEVVEETLKGHCVRLLAKSPLGSLDMPKVRRNPLIEIIPISSGCLGACTYCKTKHARGNLESYSIDQILERMTSAVAEGVQQIWFTSEDVGAYGIDHRTHIGELLTRSTAFLETIEQRTGRRIMLRVGMTNPPYMLAHVDTVAETLNHRNVFRFIHIPVQSGSNPLREYAIEDFEHLVDYLLAHVPNITIATDIICGFPGETDDDHRATVDLISRYKFPIVNISQFYARPGTVAARRKRVPSNIVKQRSGEVSEVFRSYRCTDFLLGSRQRVWFSESQPQTQQTIGHTIHYIKCVVPIDPSLVGTARWVEVTEVSKWHVVGQLCPEIDLADDCSYPILAT